MMSIGTVRGLVGSVTVTDSKGVTRELRVGDAVEINDTVQAAAGSTVHIAFTNGNFATIGSHEKLVLDPSVIDPMAESDDKAATGPSVADIQAMIAEGADPTEIAEATAAGADAGTRGDPEHSGSHSFVVVGQDAARGEVTPGFETGTFSNPVPESEIYDGGLDPNLLNPDLSPDNPPPPENSNPVIVDGGENLFLKESGVGTIEQGGKPGWAIGEHNHVIAGKPVDEGSFKVTDADGDTLTATLLDKDGVPMKGVVTDDSGTMTVQTEYGTLTVTPTQGADGSVTYTYHYELDNTLANSLNEGDDPVQEHFQIEVSDGHGGTITQPVDITIEGTNDAPTFNNHGQNVHLKEEGVYNGNHETTDDHKDNGHVSSNNDRPKVQGDLSTFVTDADKGADLTYTVDHFNVKNTSVDSVETTLFTGNNTPVIDDQTGEAVSISVEMVGKPTIDANGIQTVHTNYGVLTIDTKTGHYTFELGGSEEADKLVNSMAAGEKFTFQFETLVTDQFGAIGKHVLNVIIEGANDIPTLTVDKLTLDVTEQGENVSPDYTGTDSGNAQGTDIDRGADLHYSLVDENGKETTSIKTEYGTLTIDADGKYHFTIDNTSESVKALGEGDTRSAGSFTIRVTDEHGAYTEQEIEVNVHGAKDAPVVSDHLVVNEHGLDNAFDASESALIKAPDGYTIVGVEDGKHGTVSPDGEGNWHYTLNKAIDSGDEQGTNTVEGADTVKMTVQDAYGNQFTVDVKVDIVDDVPVLDLAGQGYQDIHVGSGASVSEAAGSINYDFGADDGQGKSFTVSISDRTVDISDILSDGSYTIQGEYGKLTIFADGSYNYQANPNILGNAQDSFTLTITDADGDTKNVKLDVTVDPPSGPGAGSIADVVVDEAGLNDADNTSEISKPVTMPDGYTIVDSDTGYHGNHGTLAMDAHGNWHYTLNEAIDSGKEQGINTVKGGDTVKVTVQDAHGNQFTVDVNVDIIDDVPVLDLAGQGYQNIHVGSGASISEAAGSINYDFGADDGPDKWMEVSVNGQVTDITEIASRGSYVIEGEYGKLTIFADGSYHYQANTNISGEVSDSFTITISDADHDTKNVTLNVNVTPSGITAENASAIVSEHDIAGNDHVNAGTDASHGQDNLPGNPASDESGFSGHLDLDYGANGAAPNGAFAWNVPSGNNVQAMVDGSWQSVTWKVNGTTLTGTAGGQTVFTLTIDPATGDYQASLNAAMKHNAPDGSNLSDSNVDFAGQSDASSGLHFGFTITDASGNTAKGGLDVDVQDDVPVFSQSSDSVTVTDHHLYTDNSELKFTVENIGEGKHTVSFGENLSISAGTVHYGKDGNISTIDSSDGTLYYKNPPDSKFAGLGVQDTVVDDALMNGQDYNGRGRFPEINYSQGSNSSEAIVIDLNGKIAYGMNIGLSNFFGGKGEGAEKALFTFYLNGEIVDVKELTSAQQSGLVNGTFNSVTAGFDQVVISAIDNGISHGPLKDNSDFSITSIQFVTASGQPLSTAEGHIEATSADGIKSYDFGNMAFETADGEKISLTHTASSNGDLITGTLADGTVVLEGFLSDNGTWSLHQYQTGIHNAGSHDMSLDFVATDNDGDRTTHHVVIPASPDIANVEVNEHGLNDGPDGNDHSETVDIKAPDGFKIVDIADGEHGKVTQYSDGQWHYTLNEAINSGDEQGTNTVKGADTVKVTVEDAHGNQFTVDVKVDIIDDVPTVNVTDNIVNDVMAGQKSTDDGKLDFDFGADDGSGKQLTISVEGNTVDISDIALKGSYDIAGKLGTLTIHADGTYTYKANPDARQGQDSFDVMIKDADGDWAGTKIDVNVSGATGPDGSQIAHIVVNEHGLDNAADNSEMATLTAPDGYVIVKAGDGELGTVTFGKDGQWHYTLNKAIDSGDKQGTNTVEGADTVKMTVEDAHGNQFTIDVKVDIIDDIPVVNTTYGVGMQDMVNATDGVDHFKAGFDFDFGADKGEGKSVEVSIDGQVVTPHHTEGSIGGNHQTLSSLEVNEKTGEVSYEQNSEVVNTAFGTQGQAHDITVSVTDSDGDVVSQTVHLETVGMQVGGVHSDTITGGSGADIIIGDKGHIDGVQNTVTYNLSLVLDVSNSMYAMLDNGNTRLASSVEALSNLIDSIAAQTAQGGMTVNIQLVGFHSSAFQHSWLSVTQDNVNELKNYVNELAGHIRDGGASNTNYQAAFGEICEWFGKLSDVSSAQGTDVVNKVYFISDGVPNSLTINGAIVDYGSLHQQPDWPADWPHDSYAPDYFIYAREYVLSHTNGYATLLNQVPGLEMNSAGFAGSGLDAGTLDHFDNTGGGQILHNSHDLTEFLKPGVVVPPVDADRDTVYAGAGNDIVFGDHVHFVAKDGTGLDGQSALIAAVSAAGGDTSSNASIHQFLTAHPELADTLADPNPASNQNDLLVGGTGHDILVGQGGNDLLIGDGDNSVTHKGSLDHIDYLLDSHAQGDDLAAGIRHLFDHGTAQEISHFTSGIENMDVESSHDGNDHLYGGTGNDVLVGMGGNDHLYGGEGHDILLGGSGNDVLVGGKGDDILSGGSGNDIFRYTSSDLDGVTNGDTITDFHLGNLNESKGPLDVNADVLDISELITGHDKPTSLESLVNGGYLNFEDVTENADGTLTVKLSIDVDGHHGDAQTTNLATITMSGFEHHAGTDIVQDLMNQLVNNENIKF